MWTKEKSRKWQADYRARNLEKIRIRQKKWRDEHPDHKIKYNKKYRKTHLEEIKKRSREWYQSNRHKVLSADNKAIMRLGRLRRRLEVISRYSDGKNECACCGEKQIRFLTIDHENGGGNCHRKQIKRNLALWLWSKPRLPGYQVLCYNCKCAKGFFGICPHKIK